MSAWSHLHNARHIDWVIASVKENPDIWAGARNTTRVAAWNAACCAAWNAAHDAARLAAWNATWSAAYDSALNAARYAARVAARGAVAALVAYDDCDGYLSMSYEQLRAWALLSETPQAVLLLPMKWVQENECLVTPT